MRVRITCFRLNLQNAKIGSTECSIHDAVNDPIKSRVYVADGASYIYQRAGVPLHVSTRLHDPSDLVRHKRQSIGTHKHNRHISGLELRDLLLQLLFLCFYSRNDIRITVGSRVRDRLNLTGHLVADLGSMMYSNYKNSIVDEGSGQCHGDIHASVYDGRHNGGVRNAAHIPVDVLQIRKIDSRDRKSKYIGSSDQALYHGYCHYRLVVKWVDDGYIAISGDDYQVA